MQAIKFVVSSLEVNYELAIGCRTKNYSSRDIYLKCCARPEDAGSSEQIKL